jgi:hypothetical protein
MSMFTQHGGGNRKPSTKAVAGAKPKQGDDEVEEIDTSPDLDTSSDLDTSPDRDTSPSPASAKATKAAAASASAKPRAKAAPRKSAPTRTSGSRPGGASKATGRRVAPVKVQQDRPWGPIALFTAVAAVAVGIIGFAGYQVYQNGLTWQERADKISGIVDYHKTDPQSLTYQQHTYGPIKYKYNPPVGGTHNPNWQRCLGDVYPAPIASEHAVHSLEHGAVWIAYNPSLPKDQVEELAKKVRGNDYMLMSPFPNLDAPIALQTWGYQLKVQKASDSRIDEFIKALKQKAAFEQGATCSSGNMITETGTTPHDLGKDDPNAQNNMGNDGGANSGQNTGTGTGTGG